MSAKSRERREKHHAREQAAQSSQNASPPASDDGQYIHPIMIHPIEYHNSPAPVQEIPRPDTAAATPQRPTAASSFFPDELIESQFIRKKPQVGFDTSHFVKKDERVNAADITPARNQEMENALAPRTASGTPLTSMSVGTVARVQIPAFTNPSNPTPENPIRPIVYAEEFSNGNTPEGFHYADGYAECKMGPDGNPVITTMYADPVRNLTAQDQAALELGRKLLQPDNAAQQTSPRLEDILSPEEDEMKEIGSVTDCPAKGCLIVITKKGQCRLTNFRIIPVESKLILGKLEREEPRLEYTFEIRCCRICEHVTVGVNELDNIVKVIQSKMPICTVTPSVMKAPSLISNYVREQIMDLPQRIHVKRTGFMQFDGAWMYVHDGAIPPVSNLVFDTGRYIPNDHHVTDAQAFHNAIGFLDICSKDELIIPLVLEAHLGPLFRLFQEAGKTPRFVTILTGRSGSLKTSMSLVLFRLFHDQGQSPAASFRDTETAMEIKLGELNSSVGIFDDFAPPAADNFRAKATREKLETIIRYIGDHVSKSRSNTQLGKAKEFIPSGVALVTAEDTSGTQSSLLRCLILNISKGDIDGSRLRRYQNAPDLIPTHMNRFLNWVGLNGCRILEMIRREYHTHQFDQTVTELRLIDTAETLLMVARILTIYGVECGAIDHSTAQNFNQRCCSAIRTAIAASEAMSKDANPCTMFLTAFFGLCERGEIKLAEDISLYVGEVHDGFLCDGCAWVDPHGTYAKVRQYHSKLNTIFPLSEKQLNTHLADAELIAVSHENRDSGTKKLYTKKSSLPNRRRMMVIDLERAQSYIEENGNN